MFKHRQRTRHHRAQHTLAAEKILDETGDANPDSADRLTYCGPAHQTVRVRPVALDQLEDIWQALLSDLGWPQIPDRDED